MESTPPETPMRYFRRGESSAKSEGISVSGMMFPCT